MRKIICIFLSIAMLWAMPGFANEAITAIGEDFSVRNGISFGMTLDEVNAIETQNGLPSGDIILDYGDAGLYDLLRYNPSEIMGIPTNNGEVSLLYRFRISDSHKLYEVAYFYGDMKDQIDTYYSTLKENFVTTYGIPLHDNDGKFFDVRSIMFNMRVNADKTFGTNYLGKYCQWLIQYNDYYVDIDLFTENYQGEKRLYVGYRALSEDEVKEYCGIPTSASTVSFDYTDTDHKPFDAPLAKSLLDTPSMSAGYDLFADDGIGEMMVAVFVLDILDKAEPEFMANNFMSYLQNDSYVAKKGDNVVYIMSGNSTMLSVYMNEKTKEVSYVITTTAQTQDDIAMNELAKSRAANMSGGYHKNNTDLVMDFFKQVVQKLM